MARQFPPGDSIRNRLPARSETAPHRGETVSASMLEAFDFEVERINTIIAIMGEIPAFRPDDLDVAGVTSLREAALAVRNGEYLPAEQSRNLADANTSAAVKSLHDGCVSVYGTMKSRYRGTASLEAITRLPVDDQTAADTDKRARSLLALWESLPLPPNAPAQPGPPPHFYIPYEGMTLAVFQALLAAKDAMVATQGPAVADWEIAESQLHEQTRVLRDFTVSAGVQGRAQFPDPLSVERELIDSIPTDPPVSAPGSCTITQASSEAPGEVRLKVSCERATRYDWERETAPGVWAVVATDAPLSILVATGLPPGNAKFRVKGKNSVGESDWSEPAEVTIQG